MNQSYKQGANLKTYNVYTICVRKRGIENSYKTCLQHEGEINMRHKERFLDSLRPLGTSSTNKKIAQVVTLIL